MKLSIKNLEDFREETEAYFSRYRMGKEPFVLRDLDKGLEVKLELMENFHTNRIKISVGKVDGFIRVIIIEKETEWEIMKEFLLDLTSLKSCKNSEYMNELLLLFRSQSGSKFSMDVEVFKSHYRERRLQKILL